MFSQACFSHSVHGGGGGGGLPSHNAMGQADPQTLRRQTSPKADPHSEGRPPATRYGEPAGGTHPTGMHTCFFHLCSM